MMVIWVRCSVIIPKTKTDMIVFLLLKKETKKDKVNGGLKRKRLENFD